MYLPHELDDDTALALDGIEIDLDKDGKPKSVKYKGVRRDAARDQALKHLGLFKEDNEQQGQPLADAMLKVAAMGPLRDKFAKVLGSAKA